MREGRDKGLKKVVEETEAQNRVVVVPSKQRQMSQIVGVWSSFSFNHL